MNLEDTLGGHLVPPPCSEEGHFQSNIGLPGAVSVLQIAGIWFFPDLFQIKYLFFTQVLRKTCVC